MENLKVEMKPIIIDDGIKFRLKVETLAGAVECEEIIKYLQKKSGDKKNNQKIPNAQDNA